MNQALIRGKYFPKNRKLFRNKISESKNCSDNFYTLSRYVRWQSKEIYIQRIEQRTYKMENSQGAIENEI